jgi:small GTP-binding protein
MYDDDTEISCKVVLIGNSGVGKTSIINQYITNVFNEEQLTTTGATYSTKKLLIESKKKTISFEIWDTAGQEKYRSLTKMFYKDSSIVIMVYDITNEESFNDIKNYWFEEVINNINENVIMAIVGNKNDLIENEKVNEEEVKNFANEKGMHYAFISAKMKNGIDELFKDIGKKFLHPDSEITSNMTNEELKNKGEKLQREKIKNEQKKRNCC